MKRLLNLESFFLGPKVLDKLRKRWKGRSIYYEKVFHDRVINTVEATFLDFTKTGVLIRVDNNLYNITPADLERRIIAPIEFIDDLTYLHQDPKEVFLDDIERNKALEELENSLC